VENTKTQIQMRKGLTALLLLTLVASGCTVNVQNQTGKTTSTVTDVVDGDTVDINLNGTTETVRLLGVDTPEVHVEVEPSDYQNIPDNEEGRQCLREWGEKASQYAEEKLSNQEVKFVTDPRSDTRGSYGRLLGYIKVNGTNFNYRLVEKGLARVYQSDFTQQERFLEAEDEARSSMKGLWRCQEFELRNLTVEQG